MFKNYWKVLFRNVRKHKFFSAINILGLATGMACCMLISLYIFEETHFDRHHANAQDLYRVGTVFLLKDSKEKEKPSFNTPAPLAAALLREFPQIEKTARVQGVFDREKTLIRSIENGAVQKAFNEPKGCFADSSYFELFAYEFLEGNPAKALTEPQTVVLSDEIARKLYGNEPAYGRIVRISNNWFPEGDLDFRVTGVFRQPEAPSHLKGRFFMSLYSGDLGNFVKTTIDLATNNMFSTYLLLKPGSDGKALESKLPAFVEKYAAADLKARGFNKKQFLTPLREVHLSEAETHGGSRTYLYILGCIALFTLLIACFNFMNLSTARSAQRAGEVGIRKAVGANTSNLVGQFLGESLLISMVSFVLALGISRLALPAFNVLAERNISLTLERNPALFGGFLGLAIFTGLLAGLYPAFYLSSFKPVEILKGKMANGLSAAWLRKGLVVFQFVISAGLILASLVIREQLHFLQSKDLGFTKDRQIILPLLSKSAVAAYEPIKNALRNDSRVRSVGASQYYPGIANPSDTGFRREGQSVEQSIITLRNWVDDGFLKTLGVQTVAGRLFSAEFPADADSKMIINEVAAKKFGFLSSEEAIGKEMMYDWKNERYRFTIVGVVKDFHFKDLHEPIEPYAFHLNAQPSYNYMLIHASAADMSDLLAGIEKIWKQQVPGEPFEYSFLDDDFQKNYQSDRQMAGLVGMFTGIAILISCLGLFGLAAFAAERRTKEIGIRKVLGASVQRITGLLAADFLKLVVIAIVIASPLAYYFMEKWLTDFAYRIEIQGWMFVVAGLVAVAIAFLTVSFQSIKAALANPVKSLRSE